MILKEQNLNGFFPVIDKIFALVYTFIIIFEGRNNEMNGIFDMLISRGLAPLGAAATDDGLAVLKNSLSDLLVGAGIDSLPDGDGEMAVTSYFDDWHLYCLEGAEVYGLLKLREQESDRMVGDGDDPGVTVSFISFDVMTLLRCLDSPGQENRRALCFEINRTVTYRGQSHHPAIKEYFSSPQSKGAYLIAELYVEHVASFAADGRIRLPDAYENKGRLGEFVKELCAKEDKTLCDGEYLYFENPKALTYSEKCAILATHTGNTSFNSFAAEVVFHAMFLTPVAKLTVPFFGSVYGKAIRADMTVSEGGFNGPTPYYNEKSSLFRDQVKYHGKK